MITQREILMTAYRHALDAASPQQLVPAHLPPPPRGQTLVIGGGKAAAAMAQAVEEYWPADAPLSGWVVTRYGHGLPCRRIQVVEAGHPLPDGQGTRAARKMLDAITLLGQDDLLLVLLSGGGSSLLALPREGIDLMDLRAVTQGLLSCGASIREINTVRKHLTRFSGGQVAAMSNAPVVALIISDVVGNDPSDIASGPCAPDPTTYADALAILSRYSIKAPTAITTLLERGLSGKIADTPKAGDPVFTHVENRIIGSATQSLEAASRFLHAAEFKVINLGEIEGAASEVARQHAQLLKAQLAHHGRPLALLSGGETTVTVRNPSGRGGRNTEYLLALGLSLRGERDIWAIACDTDGIDGTEDNAGAVWTPDSYARSLAQGIDADALLRYNQAYDFFSTMDNLVVTGPTRTNVNDFRLVLAN